MKFEFDPVILFPDIWFKNAHFFKFTLVYPSKKGAFLYFSNMAKKHLFTFLHFLIAKCY